jgi:predicted aspartyl protease
MRAAFFMRETSRSLLSILLATAFMAAALPAAAAECGPLKLVTSLDMIVLPSGRPAISVMIGDRPQILLVDTGSVSSQLSQNAVRELSLTTTLALRGGGLRGDNGAISNYMVRLPSITIGNLRQEGAYFFVSPEKNEPNDKRPAEFAGILASEFLQHFDVDFDFAANKLNLFSPDHCAGQVVYWPAPAVAIVPMQIDAPERQPAGQRRVLGAAPVSTGDIADGGRIIFPMVLDGKRVNGKLDTGATITNINLDVARRVFNVDVNAPGVEKVDQRDRGITANGYRSRFKTLEIEGVAVTNPVVDLLPDLQTGGVRAPPPIGSLLSRDAPSLVLGMSTLSMLHVYIAYQERKLYITAANPGPVPPAR